MIIALSLFASCAAHRGNIIENDIEDQILSFNKMMCKKYHLMTLSYGSINTLGFGRIVFLGHLTTGDLTKEDLKILLIVLCEEYCRAHALTVNLTASERENLMSRLVLTVTRVREDGYFYTEGITEINYMKGLITYKKFNPTTNCVEGYETEDYEAVRKQFLGLKKIQNIICCK